MTNVRECIDTHSLSLVRKTVLLPDSVKVTVGASGPDGAAEDSRETDLAPPRHTYGSPTTYSSTNGTIWRGRVEKESVYGSTWVYVGVCRCP